MIEDVRRNRELDSTVDAPLIPIALHLNLPWQKPEKIARVGVVRRDGSLVVVDPRGEEDFVLSLPELRDTLLHKPRTRFGFGYVSVLLTEGQIEDLVMGVPFERARKRGKGVQVIFRKEHIPVLEAVGAW